MCVQPMPAETVEEVEEEQLTSTGTRKKVSIVHNLYMYALLVHESLILKGNLSQSSYVYSAKLRLTFDLKPLFYEDFEGVHRGTTREGMCRLHFT